MDYNIYNILMSIFIIIMTIFIISGLGILGGKLGAKYTSIWGKVEETEEIKIAGGRVGTTIGIMVGLLLIKVLYGIINIPIPFITFIIIMIIMITISGHIINK